MNQLIFICKCGHVHHVYLIARSSSGVAWKCDCGNLFTANFAPLK